MKTDSTYSVPQPLFLQAAVGTRLLVFAGAIPVPHRLPKQETIVGRGKDADIRIDDPSLSRAHARIVVVEDAVHVEDLVSTNGTRVRGVRITGLVALQPGELFHLGNVACVVERIAEKRIATRMTRAQELRALVQLVAASDIAVFIHGETGTGKEVTARAVHDASPRAVRPFIAFNCGALPEGLIESELFGFERGAFSGADRAKPGIIEAADGGTLFLDEIGDAPLALQTKLLRVLESRAVQRLGALAPKSVDVRLVSASHKDLDAEVEAHRFRQDLFFRIHGIAIDLPPLRERLDELEGFADGFLGELAQRAGRAPPQIAPDAARLLRDHSWPGNLRELKNAMERALVLCAGADVVRAEHLPLADKAKRLTRRASAPPTTSTSASPSSPASPTPAAPASAEHAGPTGERQRIIDALQEAGGNQYKAAELLGMSRRTLVNRLVQLDIPRPRGPRKG